MIEYIKAIEEIDWDALFAERKVNLEKAKARGVPMKICPRCFAVNYNAVKACSVCFQFFPKRIKK